MIPFYKVEKFFRWYQIKNLCLNEKQKIAAQIIKGTVTSVLLEITLKCKIHWAPDGAKKKQHKWRNAISNKSLLIKRSVDSVCMDIIPCTFSIWFNVSLVHFQTWIPKWWMKGKH